MDLAPDSGTSRAVIQSWFANHTGAGETGAQEDDRFLSMLLDADPAKQVEASNASSGTPRPPRTSKPTAKPAATAAAKDDRTQELPKHSIVPPVKKVGIPAARSACARGLAVPDLELKYVPVTIEVDQGGGMAYERGRVESTMKGEALAPGNYLYVWCKRDGEWRVTVWMWNVLPSVAKMIVMTHL